MEVSSWLFCSVFELEARKWQAAAGQQPQCGVPLGWPHNEVVDEPVKDSGRHTERSHVQHRGVKADWAAKITGHCSGEAASGGRPHHQDATWTTSQSCYVMDSSWKWQETRSANKDTFKEDLVDRGVDWNSVRAVATDGELLLPIVLTRTGGSKC